MTDTTIPDAFPRGVTDPFCSQGHVVETPTDRRLLWHLELELSQSGDVRLREQGLTLAGYLASTCEHHWHDYAGDPNILAHRQCLWCSHVEWKDAR